MDLAPIVLAHEEPFRIGAAEVRPATRELLLDDQISVLEPRVMQMLVALHKSDGGVVSKDDLVIQCWDGRVVGDDAINRVVSRLRNAAEWTGGAFRIETITRVGYRMVEGGDAQGAAARMDRRRLVTGASAAAAAGAAGAGAFGWYNFNRRTLSGEAELLVEQSRAAMIEPSPDGLSNAIAKLRAASELAPDSDEVWGQLALAYVRHARNLPGDQRASARSRSLAAARRALDINSDNGDALAALTWLTPLYRNWLAFEKRARGAWDRHPRHPEANMTLAAVLFEAGRNRESLIHLDRTIQAVPMALYAHMFRANALRDVGRLDESDSEIEQSFRLWPRHAAIWFTRYYLLIYSGRAHEALAMIADRTTRPTGIPDWNFDLSRLQAQALATKDKSDLDRAVTAWSDAARRGSGFAENAAIFTGAIGRIDEAFEILGAYYFERGFRIGERRYTNEQGLFTARPELHTYFLFHSKLARFRRDPRFAQLTRELGLDDYWRRSGSRPDYLA